MLRKIVAVWVSSLIILCAITIMEEISPHADGTTITVDDDGPADHSKIQDAINASSPGDTVFVHSGTYYENLVVNKTINLTGEDKKTTIIDGMRNDNTIFVTADFVNITGFTIYNSSRVWANPDGGIKLVNVNSTTIKDNICTGNIIGIVLDNSHWNVIDNNDCSSNTEQGINLRFNSDHNILTNNVARANRAGIVLYGACTSNTISHNNASSNNPYHGINLDSNCHWNNIYNNYVSSNTDEGIFLFANCDNNRIENNTIKSNMDHGVILGSSSDNNKIYHNNFFSNSLQATDSGSANVWDSGYPGGGNYWSNFDEPGEGAYDDYKGVNQSINGSDGIVDNGAGAGGGKNPYNVQGGSKDNYPFIEPYYITPPSAPINPSAEAGNGYVNFSWEAPISHGRSNITGYYVHRSDTAGIYAWIPPDRLWYYDVNVINGVTYTYNVSAFNSIGEGSNSTDVSAKPRTIPSAPENPYAVSGDGFINIHWEEPGDDGGSAITVYRIYRGESPGGETFLDQVPGITYYIDSDVTSGITYYFKISAVNVAGEGPLSDEIHATILSVPNEPEGLIVNSGDGFVTLEWEVPSSDGGSQITGYHVYRNTTSDGTIVIFDVGDVLQFNDSSANNGVEYEYSVSAKNAVGEGPRSLGIIATPLGLPWAPENLIAMVGDSIVNLSWEFPASDGGSEITGYNVYRGGTDFVYATTSKDQLWYYDDVVQNGITYTYYITAITAVGESSLTDGCDATPMTVPTSPVNLQMVSGDGYVNLTWEPPNNDGGSPVSGYRLYRGGTPDTMTLLMEFGYHHSFNDTGVVNNHTYFYSILAINSVGESTRSDEVNGTPKVSEISEIEEPTKNEPEEIPLWLLLLHIILLIGIIIAFILLRRMGKKGTTQNETKSSEKEEQQDHMFEPLSGNMDELPPPPPPPEIID